MASPTGAAAPTPTHGPENSLPTATTTTTAAPSPEPSGSPTPTASSEPPQQTGQTVELSPDGGVGDLMAGSTGGTPQALPSLVTLLGEPDSVTDGTCNLDFITTASWGDLRMDLDDGTLLGWSIVGGDYPERVTTPHGIEPGDHLRDAVAVTGVQPVLDESFGVLRVQQDLLQWLAPPEDGVDAHIVVVAYNPVTCG